MKSRGSLACLLLALCLGSGEAGPLLRGGESAGVGAGEALGHGVGDAIGQGVGNAISQGVEEAAGQGAGEAAGPAARDAVGRGIGEAARALGNTGGEAGRQVENVIQHGADAVHGSWQGAPGSDGAWGTNGQPPSGGHGIFGSQGGSGGHGQGNPGGPGTPWGQGYPGGSDGSFGNHPQGGSWGQGGSFPSGTNAQGTVVQPGYGSVRGSNSHSECTNPPPSGSGGSSGHSGGGSGSGSGGSSGGGSSSSGGSSGGGSSSGSGSSSGGGGSSGGGSSSSGSSSGGSGGSGGSSYGPSWDRPLENSRNFDQSGYSGSQGHNTPQGHNTGSSWGSSSSGSGGGSGSGNKPGCDSPGNDVRVSGGSGGQEISKEGGHLVGGPQDNSQWHGSSGGGEAVSGINTLNSQTSAGLFNFDTFWKNFKSKLGFINWDAINKGQVPRPSTRALLYFSRLWEDFKHNTPFLNWKEIIEGADATSLQKRSGGAGQSGAGWQEVAAVTSKNPYNQQAYPTPAGGQYSAKIPSKGGVTPSSSASRVRPGLLQWVKFW
ncbi:dermokine isoform X5 [Canis lupus familiaris]|uniref:dermokine isoform X5 n=1 Tax=Canis lupus familiaris TaxID=9615 RepID=UPI0018F5BF48|nr:dermokine isoform X5 [Canis lupus familiaris]